MELVRGGELFDVIVSNKTDTWGIFCGTRFCHVDWESLESHVLGDTSEIRYHYKELQYNHYVSL